VKWKKQPIPAPQPELRMKGLAMKLVIINTEIHRDTEGRYSLNDLHKAAGGAERHGPDRFLRLDQTQLLIDAISNSPDSENKNPLSSKTGRYGGSYGAKELVYAYAMWISPQFHLQVIRAYDALATGNLEKAQLTANATATAQKLSRTQVSIGLMLIRAAAQDLNYAPSAVLGAYQRLEAMTGIAGLLPAYAVDAPTVDAPPVGLSLVSSEPTKAIKFLLSDHGVEMSAAAFNQLLAKHGFLEEHTRPSSDGQTKKFWAVTDMEYGKNLTSPNNPRETQPHWYISKFPELLELVMPARLTVEA